MATTFTGHIPAIQLVRRGGPEPAGARGGWAKSPGSARSPPLPGPSPAAKLPVSSRFPATASGASPAVRTEEGNGMHQTITRTAQAAIAAGLMTFAMASPAQAHTVSVGNAWGSAQLTSNHAQLNICRVLGRYP